MAIKAEEAWVSSDGTIVAVRKRGGGFFYFLNTEVTQFGKPIAYQAAVAQRIANAQFEIMEAKKNA